MSIEDRLAILEQRQTRLEETLRVLFEHNALGDGITVHTANFDLMPVDTAVKCKGCALHPEGHYWTLDNLRATAMSLPIPVSSIVDASFLY